MCFSPSLTGRLFQRYQLFCIILFTQTSTHLPFSVAMSRGWTTQGDRMNANAKGVESEKRKNRRFFHPCSTVTLELAPRLFWRAPFAPALLPRTKGEKKRLWTDYLCTMALHVYLFPYQSLPLTLWLSR